VFSDGGDTKVAAPWQEVVNAVDRVIGDMRQRMAQPGFGVDPVQLGRADQRVDGGGALAPAVGAGEQVIASADGNAAPVVLFEYRCHGIR